MRTITERLHLLEERFRSGCENYSHSICAKELCWCSKRAEVWAYIQTTIDEDYWKYTIEDFTGEIEGKQIIPMAVVAKAKEEIVKYCYSGIEMGEPYDALAWSKKSIIGKRREAGTNLIVYGNPFAVANSAGKVRTIKQPLGKTMLAGIVLKEAIFRRLFDSSACTESYVWVDYMLLCNRLMEHARGDESRAEEIATYEDADWLVVDKIEAYHNSDAARGFRASVLDKLFGERLDRKKPNILVFQDDISHATDMRADFGSCINGIVANRKTFKIALDGRNV